MFESLFSESGLSLDRLRALLEVGASGSIARAAAGDPVRQSQYSRQIKELEDFFQSRLIERQGRGTRLTASGKELARISRFFLLGLSNFKRGCLAEEQTLNIGASPTCIRHLLLPILCVSPRARSSSNYATESLNDPEIERRLHDLTLDCGVVTNPKLSRPLQTRMLQQWKLQLWVPRALKLSEKAALNAFNQRKLPLALAREVIGLGLQALTKYSATLICDSFLEASVALGGQQVAALLPDFLVPNPAANAFIKVAIPSMEKLVFQYFLAWNPRLVRLNPTAKRRLDWLGDALSKPME